MEELNFNELWKGSTPFGEQNVSPNLNPISPVQDGQDPTAYTFDQFVDESFDSIRKGLEKPLTPDVIKTNPSLSDNFRYQDNYRPQFNPADIEANTARYQKLENWGNVLSKTFDDFGYKFSHSFTEYFKSYGRLGESLIKADFSHLDPDQESLVAKYYQDQLNERENYIFQNQEEENSFFNKQFFKDVFGNAGFTLGTFAGVGVELAADFAITALTGGSAAPAIASAKMTRLSNILQQFGKGIKYADADLNTISALKSAVKVTDPNDLRRMAEMTKVYSPAASETVRAHLRSLGFDYTKIKEASKLHEKFMATLEQIPVAGTLIGNTRKVYAAGDGLSTAAKVGMTFKSFQRSMAEFNLASSEAAFEAVSTYGSTLDNLYNRFIQEEGRPPSAEELAEMQMHASAASASNYGTNTAILLLSNKITFGNLFTRFGPAGKLLKDLAETGSDKAVLIGAREGAKQFVRKNSYRAIIDASSKIGKKEATKELMKLFGVSTLGRFSLVEGFQENLQESSNYAWQDYYTRMYSREPADLLDSVSDGIKDQYTKQGLKTFLMGAFTGIITQPVIIGAQRGINELDNLRYQVGAKNADSEKMSPYNYFRKEQDAQIASMNNYINQMYSGHFEDLFSNKILNFNVQQKLSEGMAEAAAIGDHYEFNNFRENALFIAVKAAMNTNSLDALLFEINRLGKSYGTSQEGITDPSELKQKINEDFQKAFGIDLSKTKYDSPAALTESIISDIKTYADTIKKVKDALPTITPFDVFPEKSTERWLQATLYSTVNEASEVIAFNQIKSAEARKRTESIRQELADTPGLEGASSYLTRVLTNGASVESEIGLLDSELKQLEKSLKDLTGESKKDLSKQLKDKQKERELLLKWLALFGAEEKYGNQGFTKNRRRPSVRNYGNTVLASIMPSYYSLEEAKREEFLTNFLESESGSKKTKEKILEDFKDTLAEIVDLKNKQSGITSTFRESLTNEVFTKILDYSNLDNDTLDYLDAVDALSNPDSYKQLVFKLTEGRLRAYANGMLDRIREELDQMLEYNEMFGDNPANADNIYKEKLLQRDELVKSEEFTKLEDYILSEKSVLPNSDEIIDLIKTIGKKYEAILGIKTLEPKAEESVSEDMKDKPIVSVKTDSTAKAPEEVVATTKEKEITEDDKLAKESRPIVFKDFNVSLYTGRPQYSYTGFKKGGIETEAIATVMKLEQKGRSVIIIVDFVLNEYSVKIKDYVTKYNESIEFSIEGSLSSPAEIDKVLSSMSKHPKFVSNLQLMLNTANFEPIIVDTPDSSEVIDTTLKEEKTEVKEEPVKPKEEVYDPIVTSFENPDDILARARAAKEASVKEPEIIVPSEPDQAEPEVKYEIGKDIFNLSKSQINSLSKLSVKDRAKYTAELAKQLTIAFNESGLESTSENFEKFRASEVANKIISNFKGEEIKPAPKTEPIKKSVPKVKTTVKKEIKPQDTDSVEKPEDITSEDAVEKLFKNVKKKDC